VAREKQGAPATRPTRRERNAHDDWGSRGAQRVRVTASIPRLRRSREQVGKKPGKGAIDALPSQPHPAPSPYQDLPLQLLVKVLRLVQLLASFGVGAGLQRQQLPSQRSLAILPRPNLPPQGDNFLLQRRAAARSRHTTPRHVAPIVRREGHSKGALGGGLDIFRGAPKYSAADRRQEGKPLQEEVESALAGAAPFPGTGGGCRARPDFCSDDSAEGRSLSLPPNLPLHRPLPRPRPLAAPSTWVEGSPELGLAVAVEEHGSVMSPVRHGDSALLAAARAASARAAV